MSRGQKKPVLEVAGVGHRITHEGDLPKPRTITAVAVQMLSVQPRPPGGRAGAAMGRTFTVQSLGELEGEDPGEAPDPSGVIEVGSPNTLLGKERVPVAIADEEIEIPCENDSDGPILTGSLTVFVNGKPIVRRTDELDCGAFVGEGEPTVLVVADRQERTEKRPPPGGITRGRSRGPNLGREMQTRSGRPPLRIGRELAGADTPPRRRRRRDTPSGLSASIGRKIFGSDAAGLLQLLTR